MKSPHPDMHQLSFLVDGGEDPMPAPLSDPVPVTSGTVLSVARVWFRQMLIGAQRTNNTIESYIYDLVVLQQRIGDKPIYRITETDIALFLADATSKVTRKRRLTSVKAFFRYLVDDLEVLKDDPSADFSPHPLEHRKPPILTAYEREFFMQAAYTDEPWSASAIWLMLYAGLGRMELLGLHRDHIDRTPEDGPRILIAYDTPGKMAKQRILPTNDEFRAIYDTFLALKEPPDVLFPYGPQAINGMVERVAKAAGIRRRITPQLLRHTAAVLQAQKDPTVNHMLAFLGLANDARNRETVRIYIAMATEEATSADNPND